MRKTIYVPDGFDWGGLKVRAKDAGLSVSEFLLGGRISGSEVSKRLDRIESKLDGLATAYRIEHAESPVAEHERIVEEGFKGHPDAPQAEVDLEQEKIRLANERLLKKRREIPNAIKTVDDVPNFFNPQPKQTKKGAK